MSSTVLKTLREWLIIIVIGFVLALVIQKTAFAIYIVDGHSMEPTLTDRERVFVNRIPLYFGKLSHGDIVIFPSPEDGRNFVKRVIGLPGDSIEIHDGVVYLNDEILHEPYLDAATFGDLEKCIVAEDHVFVMGDNRGDSKDSRDPRIGQIQISKIKGEATFVVFPFPHGLGK